jgi:hypothetical protein
MARSLWPQGLHVALITIDAVVDLPKTRQNLPDKPDSFFLKPDDVAATAVWLYTLTINRKEISGSPEQNWKSERNAACQVRRDNPGGTDDSRSDRRRSDWRGAANRAGSL